MIENWIYRIKYGTNYCWQIILFCNGQRVIVCWNLTSMNYVDSDMSNSTNTVVYFDWKDGNLYLRLRTMSHTIYAAKFQQTINFSKSALRVLADTNTFIALLQVHFKISVNMHQSKAR
jgi:hypothetical protein